MASVKLVSGQSLHHPHHHPHYYPHHLHLLHAANPSKQIMTLDYSLPLRSTSTDRDQAGDSARDVTSPMSPAESEGHDHRGLSETPTKKNKRKLSEPKKRAEVTSKRPRPSRSRTHVSPEITDQDGRKHKKMANGHCKRSLSGKPAAKVHSNDTLRDTPSSSSSVSNNDSECSKENSVSAITNVINPHFLPPIFPGVQPSPFGYVPSVYLAGGQFPRPGLHATFPPIPLNLQHSFITAAAGVSHSSSPPSSMAASTTATSSLSSRTMSALAGSAQTAAEFRHSHQSTLQAPSSSSVPASSLPSALPPLFSVLHLQPSALRRPGSSRTVAGTTNDDDDACSSRAASPEDLSVGGKLSRKHRKNYKNMTRERRVEANARERTRVHTISAAFDALRRAVPSYSHNQKLSKLAILRIASSYILALARLTDQDYTSASDQIRKPLSFAECVDLCTSTIQTEGRARRRH